MLCSIGRLRSPCSFGLGQRPYIRRLSGATTIHHEKTWDFSTLDDEGAEFATSLARTPISKLTPTLLTRATALFLSLTTTGKKWHPAYMPYYYLERTLLSYPKWIVPSSSRPENIYVSEADSSLKLDLFSEKSTFDEWKRPRGDILGRELSGIYAFSAAISMQVERKKPALISINNTADGVEDIKYFPLNDLHLPAAVVLSTILSELSKYLTQPAKGRFNPSLLRTVVATKYYLLSTVKDGATIPQVNQDDHGRRLVLQCGIDLATVALKQFADEQGVVVANVGIDLISLPHALVNYTRLGGSPSKQDVTGVEFIFDFGRQESGQGDKIWGQTIAFDRVEKLRKFFLEEAKIDLLNPI